MASHSCGWPYAVAHASPDLSDPAGGGDPVTLVSHAHGFVFLKTRKTGGSSFEMLLEPYCTPPGHEVVHQTEGHMSEYGIVGVRVSSERIRELRSEGRLAHTMVDAPDGRQRRIDWISHMAAAKVRRAIGVEAWDRYTRITAVRNPFPRAVSLFYHRMRVNKLDPSIDLSDTRSAFRDYVLSDAFYDDYEITHIGGKPVFHDAFRLEHREEDIARIGQRLGVPLDATSLAHVKKRTTGTEDSHVADIELFDSVVVDTLRRKCAWVFDHYDYSRELEDANV